MNRSPSVSTASSSRLTNSDRQLSQFTAPGRACAKFVWHSPPKVRRITRLLKGYLVKDALDMLKFYRHGASLSIYKVVKSAAHNYLQSNPNSTIDMLQIQRAFADDGPRVKRLWRRARGRADILLKRMCHITVIVDAIDSATAKPKAIASVRLQSRTAQGNRAANITSPHKDSVPASNDNTRSARAGATKKSAVTGSSSSQQSDSGSESTKSQSTKTKNNDISKGD